ncbi:MAG: type III restriction-modification system endonuclease [Opitutales bacterium]
MKLKFKIQPFQTAAVQAVVDCFAGQPKSTGISYRMDPGRIDQDSQRIMDYAEAGFKNADIRLANSQILENIHKIQRGQNLPQSFDLVKTKVSPINLDIEMETGTGKTYCYIKTMFEMHRRYGWSKFIVVVPSIAIREGVFKSFQITADNFLEQYGKRARFFIYDSKQLHNLESFSSDSGLNVMIINVQAFNARGKDARRIYEELDGFQSRRPIDVISRNRPILIIDEPQKIEGAKGKASKSFDSLREFNPLMILRYSATHRKEHNKVYRLDALDAFNQKLVKKIDVRGISLKNLSGTNAFLYLESIQIRPSKPPEARLEMEIRQKNGIKRIVRKIGKGDNLFDLSGELDQYKGFVVSEIDARGSGSIEFTNGVSLIGGEATGDVNEGALRRIQIREAIKAHFEKEKQLFNRGVKVLTLFFIDEVAKYRVYKEGEAQSGEYAQIFEEEYTNHLNDVLELEDTPYQRYLKGIDKSRTHNGYFSIDKKSKRFVDPKTNTRGENAGETDDADAYDLILKDKERLLSLEEPVRFIFSHSALREGWDNPNVFVICTLKHSDNTISRRQEVGRGLRISVNQAGDRMDIPGMVHEINALTVVANESYKDFVAGLQKDIKESLSARPRVADEQYFTGKILQTESGPVEVTPQMAKALYRYLVKNDFTDNSDHVTETYHEAKRDEALPPLPEELAPYAEQVIQLIDSVYSDALLPEIGDDRGKQTNNLNANFEKKEFRELWSQINRQAAYTVTFDSNEIIEKCIDCLNRELTVAPLQYTIQQGEQRDEATYDDLASGEGFIIKETAQGEVTSSVHSAVRYDVLGRFSEETDLLRKTIAAILTGLEKPVFGQIKTNPEDFLIKAARLINEQKATAIIEHLAYQPLERTYDIDIFTREKPREDFGKAYPAKRHIYDYVFTDSKNERKFVEELDTSSEVVVYSKLPKGFAIPTPVGSYNPDWAIAFESGKVRHVFFIAETKGSMSSLELREIEKSKIDCARRFFADISKENVKYDVVDSYSKLMEIVA